MTTFIYKYSKNLDLIYLDDLGQRLSFLGRIAMRSCLFAFFAFSTLDSSLLAHSSELRLTSSPALTHSTPAPSPTSTSQLERYLTFYQQHSIALGPQGNYKLGEIELVLDPAEIRAIAAANVLRLVQKGVSQERAIEASQVGIISEDSYWFFLRDAVIFPTGYKGLYNRIIPKSSLTGVTGVVVAPLLSDGRIALILTYRHATRSWELELPRGGRNDKETIEEAAIREALEETGYRLENPVSLGLITPDSGMTGSHSAVLIGKAQEKTASQLDDSEAIEGVIALTKAQIKQGYLQGYIELSLRGHKQRLALKDPYLAFVMVAAETKGLW